MDSPVVTNCKTEGRVFIGLLIILLLVEMGIRIFEDRLSGNINHIFSIPTIVNQINQHDTDTTLLFLGNSLTNNAIDTELITTSLNASLNTSTKTLKITPDGTALSDWYCIYQNILRTPEKLPSHIVIGFAWAQLSDQYPINPTRLGGFFCALEDINKLSETGLTDHKQLLRFLAGASSHVYVNREAIRNNMLDTIIPHYKEITQQLNQTESARGDAKNHNSKQYSYHLLTDMLQSIEKSGTQIILMAMPVLNPYELDDQLLDISINFNTPLLDMRNTHDLKETMFKDTIHLNHAGQLQFSNNLSDLISSLIKGHITVTDLR